MRWEETLGRRSEGFLEGFADSEPDPEAWTDLDRLAAVRVAPHARLARLQLEGSESRERDALVRFQPLLDPVQNGLDEEGSLKFRCPQLVRDMVDEVALVHAEPPPFELRVAGPP